MPLKIESDNLNLMPSECYSVAPLPRMSEHLLVVSEVEAKASRPFGRMQHTGENAVALAEAPTDDGDDDDAGDDEAATAADDALAISIS